jgi:hypothetical protein
VHPFLAAVSALDVRRKWHFPNAGKQRENVLNPIKLQETSSPFTAIEHLSSYPFFKAQPSAHRQPSARPHQGPPAIPIFLRDEQNLNLSSSSAPPVEPSRDHFGIVEHQEVPRSEQRVYVAKAPVEYRSILPSND